MSQVPRYLMDEHGFYFNPECPELGLVFNGPVTVDDIKRVRIPVSIYRDGVEVKPLGEIPSDVAENTRVLI